MKLLIIGQILAAAIAVLIVFLGEWFQRRRDRDTQAAARKLDREHLANALHSELATLWARYNKTIGAQLMKARDWTEFGKVKFESDYFVVFDGNTSKLGLFEPEDIQTVLFAYIVGKGQVDNLINWGDQLDLLVDLGKTSLLPGVDQTIHNARANTEAALNDFLARMQETHRELEEQFTKAKTALQKYFPAPTS